MQKGPKKVILIQTDKKKLELLLFFLWGVQL